MLISKNYDGKVIIFFQCDKISNLRFPSAVVRPHCSQRGGGFTQAWVSQRFGRAINFQIPPKLSAGVHPRLRETFTLHFQKK
jgi:hypothetical protein